MATRNMMTVLAQMNLIYESVGVIIANDGQGIITIDDIAQLNEKYVEVIYQVLRRDGGTEGGMSNPGVAESAMDEANLQVMIYYINKFKRIGHTCTHAYVELAKVWVIYHQRDMEESHKDPEVVLTIDPKECPKSLETVEEYTRGFQEVDGQPLSYVLIDHLEYPANVSDTIHHAYGSKYFAHDGEMIYPGLTISWPAVSWSDPEAVGLFTDLFITYREQIRDKMVAIFQESYA